MLSPLTFVILDEIHCYSICLGSPVNVSINPQTPGVSQTPLWRHKVCNVIDDTEVLQRARDLDQDTLAEIYTAYSPGIYRYAYRLLGDAHQAEECVSEVFSRFLQALNAGGGPQNTIRPYLYRIAHNWITDLFRRKIPAELSYEAEMIGDTQANPALQAVDNDEKEQVRRALRVLTPDQRQVVLLKYYEGFTNEEVAEAIQKPVGAVKSLQHRALAAMHRMLLREEEINELIR
jgi:RNA polymerase sigma-70 factor (ECF subfamily)